MKKNDPPAGILIRWAALWLDFFFFFTLLSFFYIPPRGESRAGFTLLLLLLPILWELLLGESPGKKVLRLETVYQEGHRGYRWLRPFLKYTLVILNLVTKPFNRRRKCLHDLLCHSTVVKKKCSYRPFKALGFWLLGLNIFLTLGLGNFLWAWGTTELYDLERLNAMPETVSLETMEASENEISVRGRGLKYRLSTTYKALPLENALSFNGYGLKRAGNGRLRGTFVFENHRFLPYLACKESAGRLKKWLFSCHPSPRVFLDRLFNTTPSERWLAWNPLSLMRHYNRINGKNAYLRSVETGRNEAFSFRRIERDGVTLWWVYLELPAHEKDVGQIRVFSDYIYIATDTDLKGVMVLWKGVPRDERMVRRLIASMESIEHAHTPEEIEEEIRLAKEEHSIFHALNAFRLTGKTFEAARVLYGLLKEKGTDYEKHSFASRISGLTQEDIRYSRMIYKTRAWLHKPGPVK